MKRFSIAVAVILATVPQALSQESELVVEGVALQVQREEFIDRAVAIAPYVKMKNPNEIPSYGYLARVVNRGKSFLTIQGKFITYSSAPTDIIPYMKGGERLPFQFKQSDNLACNGPFCQRAHHFIVSITHQQIISHAVNGDFTIQFRSEDGQWKPTMTIPESHLKALLTWQP